MDKKRPTITFFGTTWCGSCARAKMVLDKLHVDYRFVNIDEDEKAAAKVEEITGGYRSVPTLLFQNGRVLVEPSAQDLEAALTDQ